MSVASFSGANYFVSFIDECSGYIVILPIAQKSDVAGKFRSFLAWYERKFDCSVKRLHSDGGGKYTGLKSFLNDRGIEHSVSPTHSPNQNAIAERANRTIVECARTMLQHSGLPRRFWAEAVVHAAKIRNSFFCPADPSKTSYEIMHGTKPDVAYFRVFGCLAWRHVPKDLRKKLDSKSELGVLVGCYENSLYKVFIPSRGVAVVSRDVTIVEDRFPAKDIWTAAMEGRWCRM